jgi:predicted DNA-binding protein with PD1-like motif
MRSKLINGAGENAAGEKIYVLIFDKGDEVITELTNFAQQNNIGAAHFTAIGAFENATLGYFDKQRKDYKKIPLNEQVEVLSLVGDIARKGDEPKVHAHVVVGKSDGSAHGGHILEARVWPTLEVMLFESPQHLQRTHDAETGLALIDLSAA